MEISPKKENPVTKEISISLLLNVNNKKDSLL